eukprot:gene11451-11597_t
MAEKQATAAQVLQLTMDLQESCTAVQLLKRENYITRLEKTLLRQHKQIMELNSCKLAAIGVSCDSFNEAAARVGGGGHVSYPSSIVALLAADGMMHSGRPADLNNDVSANINWFGGAAGFESVEGVQANTLPSTDGPDAASAAVFAVDAAVTAASEAEDNLVAQVHKMQHNLHLLEGQLLQLGCEFETDDVQGS